MKKLVKIYEKQQAGRLPVSVWVDMNPDRSFDEVIIGKGISKNNILDRRFEHPVIVCHCLRSLNKTLNDFGLNNFKKLKTYESYKEFMQMKRR